MKNLMVFCLFFSLTIKTFAQTDTIAMEKSFIHTKLGTIAVFTKKGNSDKTPVIFLHGVYFDHHLWNSQINAIFDRTIIAIDMPLHGESTEQVVSISTGGLSQYLTINISCEIPTMRLNIAINHNSFLYFLYCDFKTLII